MTLEEYEKIREEKRKALLALKAEERKVEVDKDLQSLQPLSTKKANDEIFIKLVCLPVYAISILTLVVNLE
jgi:plasminogen activator inhibitor 1 RNA-binding protein